MIRRLAAIVLILLLALPIRATHADAPEPTERLTYDDTITRTFEADSGDYLFNFYAVEGDLLTLTMTARKEGEIDPVLTILAPDGKVIAQNDDSLDERFGMTNARLINFPIPKSGLYTIHAGRSKGAKGQFTVALKARRAGESRAGIELPGTASGRLSTATPTITYEFRANAGEILSIQAKADTTTRFNPIIALLDPADKELTRSSVDKATPTVANLSRIVIKASGVYSIVVRAEKTVGKFDLEIKREQKAEMLLLDTPIEEAISTSETEQRYLFEGKAGDLMTITMTTKSGNLDPLLRLLTLDGKQIAQNDNATGAGLKKTDAQIAKFKLPADGFYIVVAGRAAAGRTTGTYTLTLSK
jgi:hypothetical protein